MLVRNQWQAKYFTTIIFIVFDILSNFKNKSAPQNFLVIMGIFYFIMDFYLRLYNNFLINL